MFNEKLNSNSKNTANNSGGKTNIKITTSDETDNVGNYVTGETRSSSSHKFGNNKETTSKES